MLTSADTTYLVHHLGLVFRKQKSRLEVRRRGWKTIFSEAEDLLRATPIDACGKVAKLSFSGDDIILDRRIFDETVMLDFEDTKIPAVKDYDYALRTQYGDDYMTPKKAPSCHGMVVFNTEKSYKEVLPEVRRAYRKSIFHRLRKKILG